MCTLALVRGRFPRYPLVIAANRDELHTRPSSPPRLWPDDVRFVAGRDETAGGTWLGVNEYGVVVGLTNHWNGTAPDPARASRGGVVRELLGARDLPEVIDRLRARDARATNPFLLIAAQRNGEALWTSSAQGLIPHAITTSVFALGNELPDEGRSARVHRLGMGVDAVKLESDAEPDALVASLAARLAHHEGDRGPLASVCVHTDRGYGTVSSTILLLGSDPGDDRLHHAPGPPCRHAFTDLSHLLEQLRETRGNDAPTA